MKTEIIFFSPTGTSKAVAKAVAGGFGAEPEMFDMTKPDSDINLTVKDGLAVFSVPVYAGRVPAVCAERMKNIRGENSSAVILVTYGNRDYDDALVEFYDIVQKAGFRVIAAGAFVGEHSYATDALPVAAGRPDKADLDKAESFGKAAAKKLESGSAAMPVIKGNRPYKARPDKKPVTPLTDVSLCKACGTCAALCPTAAITVDKFAVSDVEKCIMCCACIKKCPSHARDVKTEAMQKSRTWLFDNFSARREPEIFI